MANVYSYSSFWFGCWFYLTIQCTLSQIFDWSEKSYDELCNHEELYDDNDVDSDPYYIAEDSSTGYIWMAAENSQDECNITIRYYNPYTDEVIEDIDRSKLIGTWQPNSFNPNSATIINNKFYITDFSSNISYFNLNNITDIKDTIEHLGDDIDNVCMIADIIRNLIYILGDWYFIIYNLDSKELINGPVFNYFHNQPSCVIDEDENLLYVIGGMSPYIETFDLTYFDYFNNSIEWNVLDINIGNAFDATVCCFKWYY